jgi:BioD-like phosphotransacetylase family protein
MTRSVYLTAIEPCSGKLVVALGMMESLSRLGRMGYFRPIVPSDTAPDNDLFAVSPAHATRRRAGRLVLGGPRCLCS